MNLVHYLARLPMHQILLDLEGKKAQNLITVLSATAEGTRGFGSASKHSSFLRKLYIVDSALVKQG